MSIFRLIREEKSSLMKIFRLMEYLKAKRIPVLPGFFMRYIRVVYSCDLPVSLKLGKGVVLKHNGLGVVIHPDAIIGENTLIYQNVSIAGRNNRGVPTIGKNVFIGCGACVLGGVTIGDNVSIGANSVVINDIPDNAVVVGIPGKVVKINE
ncbi:serine acetyltransferase [Capnocytophaga stomatis]|uniref:Serine acetyltransferase n=2 Tax=Capnocytophaga stomatis TaxID=1848904 RepID=A0A250FV97_9FLAO|nr:serine acetyltransferase [Capnocytophaga stomatis]